ncbi:MAG: M23 family metallopeptidase [Maricaulis sp.]|uniref:M23 family metallopeptidase n=1 Tax=Maricaulis sp. TaxID=1486257 RepID=UPI001B00BEAF|nr:M23 family metallopeptidase [Maricaulis sp.]MBO6848614.1 M23 family metallopeptidase [Maricaulis sp.]MBO6878528.1 M23 family metallopeptidase [Maricaulis sp.]
MSRSVEVSLAAIVATAGIAAMIWWPPLEDGAEPADAPVAEDPAPAPDPEPAPEPEPEPAPEPEPEPEPSVPLDDAGEEFAYMPPGDLAPDSGTGQTTQVNYAPGMRFPMEAAQAYANSQVYGYGGYLGPAGGQCDDNNYAYAWRDNFCETRGYSTPMCPSGTGHQGQDIRPATCQDATHWAVAADEGTITSIGSYSVRLTTDDGVRYTYLHLEASSLQVSPGDRVTRGERLGFVSNEFNGTPTTIHLHFEIKMAVDTGSGIQNTNVPPYLALVDSYERLLDGVD